MDRSPPRSARQDQASDPFTLASSAGKKQDAAVPSVKAPSACTDQVSCACTTRAASEPTDESVCRDALTREREISIIPKKRHP